jgi:hypothetical protein
MLNTAGVTPDHLAGELERAAPDLDVLARQLLDRWLGLLAGVDARGERTLQLAV